MATPNKKDQTTSEKVRELGEITAKVDKRFDNPNSKLKAILSVELPGGFIVHGLKIFEGDNGSFVSMPQSSYKNANGEMKFSDIFHATTSDARHKLVSTIFSAYENAHEHLSIENVEMTM